MFDELFLHSEQFQNFVKQVKGHKQSQTYLLISKDSFSATEMATLFAKALMCENLCGECENCKKIAAHAHPDVEYFPEGAKLMVEDSKKIVEESFTRPIFADKKVFIIKDVDLSTPEAQNKLLKSLEEPNERVYYILTTTNLEKVLPTIRSRCNKIELAPAKQEDVFALLKGDDTVKTLAVNLGGGYISKSVELAKNSALPDLARLAIGLVKDTNSSKEAISWVKKVLDTKGDITLLLELVGIVIEDSIALKVEPNSAIKLSPFSEDIKKIAEALSLKCLSSLCTVIDRAVRDLAYNVALPLVADNLVMNILEVKYLCK